MGSYFHACSRSLKLCILYASIFPDNSVIRRRRLVRRWIAEGYSKGTDGNTMVDYAEELFNKFAALSMISRSTEERGTVSGFKVNGFFREYLISRTMEEKILLPLEVSVLEGKIWPTTDRIGQHLAIGKSWERNKTVFDSMDFSRLRSLTVYGEWRPFFISDRMRVLRVLDLENALNIKNEHLKEIGSRLLPRLKFLSLRGCKGISYLPESFAGLRHLQTLNIRDTSINLLPRSIMRLHNLQYIRAGIFKRSSTQMSSNILSFLPYFGGSQTYIGTDAGVKVAKGIGKLKALHTLGVVNICSTGWEATIQELSKLTQLRKLGVSGVNKKNTKQFSTAIEGYDHLESLSVRGELMPGIMSLSIVKKLSLDIELLTQSDIENLGNLKRLQTLRLRVNKTVSGKLKFEVKAIGISLEDPFSKIKDLKISCNSKLTVKFKDNVMGNLELLEFDCSHAESFNITGLQYPFCLKRVILKCARDGTFNKSLEEAVRSQIRMRPDAPDLFVLKGTEDKILPQLYQKSQDQRSIDHYTTTH